VVVQCEARGGQRGAHGITGEWEWARGLVLHVALIHALL
jgi:hypothetical protein